jgi:hypothetical protein
MPSATTHHNRIARLARLRWMLARDEQIRQPPPITLPRLIDHREPTSIPIPASKPTIPIPVIVQAVAAFYGLPPNRIIHRQPSTQPRPLPMNVCLYLVRARSGASYKGAAAQLGIKAPNVIASGFLRVAHERRLDPDLDRQIAAIETVLESTCAHA